MSAHSLLNQDGNCFSFEARGSGYGRGEGAAMVVLKRLDDALRDRDSIRGIIRGTATGHDGKTIGIMLPHAAAQKNLILSALRSAGLDPSEVGYIEAHGTGTVAGDEAEINAISDVFCKRRDATNPLFVGSIKANIGHLEATSGLAGLIKALLVLEKSMIPSTPNLKAFKKGIITSCTKINVWTLKNTRFKTGLTEF